MLAQLSPARLLAQPHAAYASRLARDGDDLRAAQALRFAVFNLELQEGLAASMATGLDADAFDSVCDHLLVEHVPTREIVGTYRLQTGPVAADRHGYYSEQEFDFRPFERIRSELIELGRACVDARHRNLVVLGLLWKGIADYARRRGGRYLCGCSSITSQDPAVGASVYAELCRQHLVSAEWRTTPREAYDCPLDKLCEDTPAVPKLLRAYLAMGAKVCGPPALDRAFKTIDFLTFLDLESLPGPVRARFLG